MKYLDLGRNTQFKAKSLEISRYAKLDASIFENLHLCSLKETSLFSILSAACQTTQGARLLRKWITQVEIFKDLKYRGGGYNTGLLGLYNTGQLGLYNTRDLKIWVWRKDRYNTRDLKILNILTDWC